MLNFKEYMIELNESRLHTTPVMQSRDILSRWLYSYKIVNNIDIDIINSVFYLDINYNSNFNIEKFHMIINICENLGYFPSLMVIDNKIDVFDDFKNSNKTDFIEFLKGYNIVDFKTIELKFESWQDKDIEPKHIPNIIYHVCREVDKDKINKYGLVPKSKSKRSFHPDRIYLFFDKTHAIKLIETLKLDSNDKYIIIELDIDDNLKSCLYLKIDPNHSNGYYTATNIHPNYISKNKWHGKWR